MKIHQNWDLIITDFIRDKFFILNLSSVTSDIAFRVKLVKLTESVKLTSISVNLSKLAKLIIKLSIELESSICNNKLVYN